MHPARTSPTPSPSNAASAAAAPGTLAPLPRVPALDGLRAVAVAAVLLFHGGFGWASGGYLGVSVFFTLSGYLITRLLLDEQERTGRLDLVRFSTRRLRRLLPASALCLGAILVLTHLGAFGEVADLRRDLLGALSQVGSNWVQLTSGRAYADLFATGASPVEHYWSLAIEEQFYLVWPIAFALLWARRPPRGQLRLALATFAVVAVAPRVIAVGWGSEAAYLSTPARLSELLAGVVLAVAVRRGPLPGWLRWATPVALLGFLALVVLTPAGAGWPYSGGLPLFALLSTTLIAGLQVDGPAARLLATPPLVAVGTVSYGIYLFHWPIFLLAEEHPAGLHGAGRFAAASAVTLLAATASYVLLERPVRLSRARPRTTLLAAVATVAAILVAIVVVAPGPRPAFGELPASTVDAVRIRPLDDGAALGDIADRPVRILVIGDSTGEVMGAGLVEWARAQPGVAQVDVEAVGGCGFVDGGRFDDFLDEVRDRCDRLVHQELPGIYAERRPDVVLISIAAADTWDRRWGDGPVQRPTDPDYRARIERAYGQVLDTAVAAGVPRVVWLRPSQIGTEPKYADPSYLDGSQELVQQAVEAAVGRHPGRVEVLDFRSWFEATAYPTDLAVRPDGVHLVPEVATAIATGWLGPELLAIARR